MDCPRTFRDSESSCFRPIPMTGKERGSDTDCKRMRHHLWHRKHKKSAARPFEDLTTTKNLFKKNITPFCVVRASVCRKTLVSFFSRDASYQSFFANVGRFTFSGPILANANADYSI